MALARGLTAAGLDTVALARPLPAMFTTVLEDRWTVATYGPGCDADLIVHNGQIIAGQHPRP